MDYMLEGISRRHQGQRSPQRRVIYEVRWGYSGIYTARSWKSLRMEISLGNLVQCLTVLMVKRFLLISHFSLRLLWVSQGLKWGQPVCRSPDCSSGPFWSWVQHLLSSRQWGPFQISVTLLSTSNSPVSALIKSPTPFTPGPHFPCSASYYQCRGRSSAHWLGYPFPISTPFEFCLSWHRPYMPR